MTMVVMDTCGNIEKTNVIKIDGYKGISFNYSECIGISKDSNIIVTALVYEKILPPRFYFMKVDMMGNILEKWNFKTNNYYSPHKVFERDSAYYITGTRNEQGGVSLGMTFIMKIDKKTGLKWIDNGTRPFYATDLVEYNDTLAIVGEAMLTKIYDKDKKLKNITNQACDFRTFSKFTNQLNAVHIIDTIYNEVEPGKPKIKLSLVKTNNEFEPTYKKELPIKNQFVSYLLLDKKESKILLQTARKVSELNLHLMDLDGNLYWSRYDTLSHYGQSVKEGYTIRDNYRSLIILPSQNIIGILYSIIYYDDDKPFPTEQRFVKFDKMGKVITNNCKINAITEVSETLDVKISPNPFSTEAFVAIKTDEDFSAKKYRFSLFNLTGQLIESNIFEGNSFTIERNNLSNGFYFCKIENLKTNKNVTIKVIVN
jgi:hypothetical protein